MSRTSAFLRIIGASLERTNFSNTNLSNANLIAAFLIETDFSETDLRGAKLLYAKQCKFRNANLSGTKLSMTISTPTFSQNWFTNANFSGADLSRSAKERHGMTASREYRSWASMIQRCYNPKAKAYKYYGGRGITVCERWRSFANFYADMGKRPEGTSIHRRDVNGNYEPNNCKWATSKERAIGKQLPSTNKSGYRGVRFDRGAWIASISLNNKATYLGRSKNKKEAARMYNQAAIVHFGPEAVLNKV